MNVNHHRLLCVCALIPLVAFESGAETTDWEKVHESTLRGIHLLYNLEIDRAEEVFDSVSRMAPGDPRGSFFQSIVHFYLYSLNRDQKELSAFLRESDEVIAICENLLDRNERDARTKFYLGGICGYRGLAYHSDGSYLNAARDGRKGYLLLEEAVNEDATLYDAHMGFGLFRYLLAKLPKSMRWILSVAGLTGDREGGLASLRLAAEKGTYTRTEAKLYLSQFLFAEGQQDTAVQCLNELRTAYPENTLFTVLYAFWQHRLNNLDEAMKAASTAVELNKRKKIHYGEELAYSTLGSVYFTLNDFDNAKTYYTLYMQMTNNDERTPGYTFLRAGLACEIAGDRETALKIYRRMKTPDTDRTWDAQNYRRGQELLRRPLTGAEILLVKGGNEHAQKKYAEAIRTCNEVVRNASGNEEIQARALYTTQQAQFDAGQFADVLGTSNRILALKPVNELWVIPHALFLRGRANEQLGNIAGAREAFEKIKEFDEYEFQDRLEARVKEELEKLD